MFVGPLWSFISKKSLVPTVFRGVETTALDAKGNADYVSELAVRDGRDWGGARELELEKLLRVGAAIV